MITKFKIFESKIEFYDSTHGWTLKLKNGIFIDFASSKRENIQCPLFDKKKCDGTNFIFHYTQRSYKGSNNYKTAKEQIYLPDIYPIDPILGEDYVRIPVEDIEYAFRYEYKSNKIDKRVDSKEISEYTTPIKFGI